MFWKIYSGVITVIAAIAAVAYVIAEDERRYRESIRNIPGAEALYVSLKAGLKNGGKHPET